MHNREAKNWNNFSLGLVIMILPFLGLPLTWKNILFVIIGLLVCLFSLANVRRRPDDQPPTQV